MSKFIRALALFSLTIGLAGCLHSDDDTVFITVPGPTVIVNVPVVDTGGIINDAGNPANTEPAEEQRSEVANPTIVTTMVEAMLATMRETMFATMRATRLAELDSDGDGTPDATDTDDNDNNIVDTDAAETGVGFPGGVFTDLNANGIHDATDTAVETQVAAEVETALANLRPGIEANVESDLAPGIAEASSENPVFPFSGFRSSEPSGARSAQVGIVEDVDENTRTRTPTNIIYSPRADLGLVEFDSDGNRLGGRVIPQVAAYEEINSRADNRRYAYYGEAVSTAALTLSETAYFVEQGAMMKFAALAYWIDSPSDALDFSTVQPLSEIGAGVFGLETAVANLPRGRAEYRGAINGFYRKRTPTEINTGLSIRPDVPENRDNNLQNDLVYPIVLRTGAQNYLVEGPVNVTAEFVFGEVNGGFTATAYEPNYRLDYNPESPADYDPDAERNDETFSQYLRGGDYHVPNRGGLRLAPAGVIAIPTIQELDENGFLATDGEGNLIRADAVVLPAITALTTTMDNLGNPVLDVNGDPLMVPVRAVTDREGDPITVPVGQSQPAVTYNPLSGTTRVEMVPCTGSRGCVGGMLPVTLWAPDNEADALAIRRSLANTLPDPFTRSRPQVPVIPSILQGQFEGIIGANGVFAGTTSIGETATGATETRTEREVVFVPRSDFRPTDTFGLVPRDPDNPNAVRAPRTDANPVPLVRRIIRQRDNNGNVIPGGTIREEAVTDGDGNPLFIVSRVDSTTQVPVPVTAPIPPTGVFSPLADGSGNIFGRFFGPNGEETAGSGNLADTDGNELVFTFGGRQIGLIPPDTLTPEDAAQIAEQTRLNGLYDDLVNLIVPDSAFDDDNPSDFRQIVNIFDDDRVLVNPPQIREELLVPDPEMAANDINALRMLSAMFRVNRGIVEDQEMLRMIDPRLAP